MAQRPSDIDVVSLNGYGWPAWTSGPMFWADEIGLKELVAGLERHKPHRDKRFRMSTLLQEKAAKAERFNA
jgi:3-hydroxyacyl-CoA dehydrogenase